MANTFTLCFEGDTIDDKFEVELTWDGEGVPDVVEVARGGTLVLVGRYASPGKRYWYRRAQVVIADQQGAAVRLNDFSVLITKKA